MMALYDRYSQLIYAVALRILQRPDQAEDVMQDILLKLWSGPITFVSGRSPLAAWLVVITRHRAIDLIRRRRRSAPIEGISLCSTTSVAKEVEAKLEMKRLQDSVAKLPVCQHDYLVLAFHREFSHRQIAEKTGTPLGTVKTRIRSSLISLRKTMREEDCFQSPAEVGTSKTNRRLQATSHVTAS
jgi:RNA polymerase sigma-70 factor (ECF subfamily)